MEADFVAGLSDSDADARIASIQRLAGLGLLSSGQALRNVIATGTEEESKWARFATLKTGDASALPFAITTLHFSIFTTTKRNSTDNRMEWW
jgi:hypothetical protein